MFVPDPLWIHKRQFVKLDLPERFKILLKAYVKQFNFPAKPYRDESMKHFRSLPIERQKQIYNNFVSNYKTLEKYLKNQ